MLCDEVGGNNSNNASISRKLFIKYELLFLSSRLLHGHGCYKLSCCLSFFLQDLILFLVHKTLLFR